MNSKVFYDDHFNFSLRTLLEYFISPGIKIKYDILKKNIEQIKSYSNALDLGCSGNSFLFFLDHQKHNSLLDIAEKPLKYYLRDYKFDYYNFLQKRQKEDLNPINANICDLPYRSKTFDLIFALDVLEHLRDDEKAIKEISRILKKEGTLILSIPQGINFYSAQDRLIGHYRRYELKSLVKILNQNALKIKKVFGIYGKLFKLTEIQSFNPNKIEDSIIHLRNSYNNKMWFRIFWNLIVAISSFFMKIDVKYRDITDMYNIGIILCKV
ncbi:MAG: class I SAM-dependent methyltransferase [Promethearchaeati archaeon]